MAHAEWLEQKFTVSWSWRPGVQGQGVGKVVSFCTKEGFVPVLSLWLRDLLPLWSHCLPLCVFVQISYSYEITSQIGSGPTLKTCFQTCKDPVSKLGHMLRYEGLGRRHTDFGGGHAIQPITLVRQMVQWFYDVCFVLTMLLFNASCSNQGQSVRCCKLCEIKSVMNFIGFGMMTRERKPFYLK